MAGGVDGVQSYFGDSASSNTFWCARARSFSTGKLSFPHGAVSLLIGRARWEPSQMPARSGTLAGVDDACAASGGRPSLTATARSSAQAAGPTRRTTLVLVLFMLKSLLRSSPRRLLRQPRFHRLPHGRSMVHRFIPVGFAGSGDQADLRF